MFKRFIICGKFHQEYDDVGNLSPFSTPKRWKSKFFSKTRKKKNPYSERGLDKYAELLADIEDKKQKIYSQMSSDDSDNIALVRFVFASSNECKPIIVKSKKFETTNDMTQSTSMQMTANEDQMLNSSKNYSGILMKNRRKKPQYDLLVTIILVLVLLAIYGRSFAILCISIGWYLVTFFRGTISTRPKDYEGRERIVTSEIIREQRSL